MSEELVKSNGHITTEQLKALEEAGIIPPGTPQVHVELYAKICNEKGLSPFSKQIYLIKRGEKYTHQTSIDGFRYLAESSGQYAGNEDYKFNDNKSEYEVLRAGMRKPETATATVHKIVGGTLCAFTATARWDEYCPDQNSFMWKKMPFLMLGKCAEALALRKAFPGQLGGLYTNEEMEQADKPAIETDKVEKPKAETQITGETPKPKRNKKMQIKELSVEEIETFINKLNKTNVRDKTTKEVKNDKLKELEGFIESVKIKPEKDRLASLYNIKLAELQIERDYVPTPF